MTTPQSPDGPDVPGVPGIPDVPDVRGVDDLPARRPSQPITHPAALARVLDVVCAAIAAPEGTLCVLFCDEDDRLVQPIAVDTLADAPREPDERIRLLSGLMDSLADIAPAGSVLVALARVGGLSATDDDISWADAVTAACAGRIRLLGVHLVTPDGSRPVPRTPRVA